MFLTGMGLSTIGAAVGAVMGWVVINLLNDVRISTDGVLLVIASNAGFVVSLIVIGVSRQSMDPRRHTIGRRALDLLGYASSVHEEYGAVARRRIASTLTLGTRRELWRSCYSSAAVPR